jgi:hypothetical protein
LVELQLSIVGLGPLGIHENECRSYWGCGNRLAEYRDKPELRK